MPRDTHHTLVIVPGLRGHVEDHWQTRLAARTADVVVVPSFGRDKRDLAGRVADLHQVISDADAPVTIVAHSAGVLTTVHWAHQHDLPVRGALLATPPDLARPLPALPNAERTKDMALSGSVAKNAGIGRISPGFERLHRFISSSPLPSTLRADRRKSPGGLSQRRPSWSSLASIRSICSSSRRSSASTLRGSAASIASRISLSMSVASASRSVAPGTVSAVVILS